MLFTLAWRNLWRNKRRTLITVSSVLFAVLLAIALLSFAGGFQQQLTESFIRQETGYLQVQDAMYLDEPSLDHTFAYGEEVMRALEPHAGRIDYIVPRIRGFSLAAMEMSSRPAMVSGIVPEKENRLRNLSNAIVEGRMFSDDDSFAVVAKGLANAMNLGVGDTLVLLGQGFQAMTAAGTFTVGGIIEFSLPELNNAMVFLPLKEAQVYFAAENRLTNLIIMVEDDRIIDDLARNIQAGLDDEWYAVRTWQELMPDMVGLMMMQDTVYTGIAWVFYIIVGFGIFGTILMMLYERMREFGILLSLGMKRSKLAVMGFIETFLIGMLGVLAGVIVGIPVIYLLHLYPIRFTGEMANYILEFGMEPVFPFVIDPSIFLNQAINIFIITLVIGLYSMRKMYSVRLLEAARK